MLSFCCLCCYFGCKITTKIRNPKHFAIKTLLFIASSNIVDTYADIVFNNKTNCFVLKRNISTSVKDSLFNNKTICFVIGLIISNNSNNDLLVLQQYKKPIKKIFLMGFCGAYEIRTRDLLRDRQAF